jgi:hypothetical protein
MGWFSKRGRDRAPEPGNATRTDEPQTQPPVFLTKVDEVIAAAERLSSSTDREIQGNFGYVSTRWGCEAILILDKAAICELLRTVAEDDLAAGFGTLSVASSDEDNEVKPPYVQLNSMDSRTFRPYRIVKREDGQLALYGHAALYQAKRAMDRAEGTSSTPSADDLINELIAIGRVEGALLAPRGSELRGRIQSVGTALNDIGGMELMLQAHATVRQSLGPVRARELEAAWDDVGSWLG